MPKYRINIQSSVGNIPYTTYSFDYECRDKWIAKRKALSECRRMAKLTGDTAFTYFLVRCKP